MKTCYECKWAVIDYMEDGSQFFDGCNKELNYEIYEDFYRDLISFWDDGHIKLPEKYKCFEKWED